MAHKHGTKVAALKTLEHEAFDPTLLAMLTSLRHTLHACPERSGEEVRTAATVAHFLSAYSPDELLTEVGGHGVVAVFASQQPGPTVIVRADLDAVRVERNEHHIGADHDSMRHVCGHDGHMTMVAGLAPLLHNTRPKHGRVALLFQPAEEIGEGAARVLEDARFRELKPDIALGLHNLPGLPLGTVVVAAGVFASASVGMYARFVGLASHAAQPELARSPRASVGRLLTSLPKLSSISNAPDSRADEKYRLITITHARLGRESFGVTPGAAEVLATLRATSRVTLRAFQNEVETLVLKEAKRENLNVRIDWVEDFPETRNDAALVKILGNVATEAGLKVERMSAPMAWSDDFGQFAAEIPSAYFGLGSGVENSGLHQPEYAFPDALIPIGTRLFDRMCRRLTNEAPE